jgi:hypothetical protein
MRLKKDDVYDYGFMDINNYRYGYVYGYVCRMDLLEQGQIKLYVDIDFKFSGYEHFRKNKRFFI